VALCSKQEPIMSNRFGFTAREVPTLPLTPEGKAKLHTYGRGLGVLVEPAKDGPTRTYNFRFTFAGRDAIMRLGRIDELTLRAAFDKANEYRAMIRDGKDPRQVAASTAVGQMTFKQYADQAIPHLAGENPDPIWAQAMSKVPALHNLPIATITLGQVYDAIKPYWLKRPVSASRCVPKLGKIFNRARLERIRVDNPCVIEDLYGMGLVPPRKTNPVKQHEAMSFGRLPSFMAKLAYEETIVARCLEWCILTGARSQEAREARWSWLNEDMTTVTVPAEFMKGKKPHTVPLPTQLTAMLHKLPRTCERIFPTPYTFGSTNAIYPAALQKLVKRVSGDAAITVHGFRSTFRDFAAISRLEEDFILEICLAHEVRTPVEGYASDNGKVRAAYQRDKLLERRRPVMQAFANYALGVAPKGVVVPFKREVA
jgi:integrase